MRERMEGVRVMPKSILVPKWEPSVWCQNWSRRCSRIAGAAAAGIGSTGAKTRWGPVEITEPPSQKGGLQKMTCSFKMMA